ncbi:MAG: glycosyltransferase family 4 protein [Gammaproteobacteria bacterium]|nr:glycosyltransferase family 4 protein [Gammaproteobacteria bacterium]MCY4275352.1 glycosyltransferase family 4 protein [Gammaproteobacteria bacterium]
MKKVAVILKGYPRLSETFIAQELLALEKAGINLIIYSLRHPTDRDVHPIHSMIQAQVQYLPEYLIWHPFRVLFGLVYSFRSKNFTQLLRVFSQDLRRDFSVNRVRRLGQAMVLYREIAEDRNWIYAHFLHTPASVACYCSILSDIPWSCSAHAKDIWTSQKWEIQEKLNRLEWLVTCTASNREYLSGLSSRSDNIRLLYHGLDLERFLDVRKQHINDGSTEQARVMILSVGRAVSKKGYDILIDALAKLPEDLHWKFVHIGGGPLLNSLKSQAKALQLQTQIDWLGPLSFGKVLEQYRTADIFVLASRIDSDGDRDGLPNVLMEALSQRLACISTDISGIPELLRDEKNGLIVQSEDVDALSNAIERLIRDAEYRNELSSEGRRTMEKTFDLKRNVKLLVDMLSE